MPFYNKRLRLPASHYRGRRTYFVTVCTDHRRSLFADPSTARWLLGHLSAISALKDFLLHAYCIMPDHVHFLVEGRSENCDLVALVDSFKQRTAFEFRKIHRSVLWQKRYYDHVLRPREAIEDVACYIWMNPVRRGLSATPQEYPLSGSQTIDWMHRSSAEPSWSPPWKM